MMEGIENTSDGLEVRKGHGKTPGKGKSGEAEAPAGGRGRTGLEVQPACLEVEHTAWR